jgi:hypothetical protein
VCPCGGAAVCALLLAAKVARATDKHGALVVKDFLARLCILCYAAVDDESSGALVHNLDELGDSDEFSFGRDGELADLEELLAVEEHARVEVWYDFVKGEGGFSVEGRNDTKGGDDLEVLVAFVNEGEVGALCANAKV